MTRAHRPALPFPRRSRVPFTPARRAARDAFFFTRFFFFGLTLHFFLPFALHTVLVFDADLGFACGGALTMSPAPWNVALDGVTSLGGENGVEQASPEHSTGDAGATKPPSTRAS